MIIGGMAGLYTLLQQKGYDLRVASFRRKRQGGHSIIDRRFVELDRRMTSEYLHTVQMPQLTRTMQRCCPIELISTVDVDVRMLRESLDNGRIATATGMEERTVPILI